MKKEKIGVLDSGLGGISVLKELIQSIPKACYFYLSDSINNPYGDKKEEEIKQIVFENVEFLLSNNCKIIVIACNTATAVAIDDLRKKYPDITFIGTEPAIKIAYDEKTSGKTLLLATKLTLESERIRGLMKKYPIENLDTYPCSGLADLIENKELMEAKKYLKSNLEKYKDIDTVILGCTHYPLIKNTFQNFFKNAKIIDGSKGIAKQTKKKVEELNLQFERSQIYFYDTSKMPEKQKNFEFYMTNFY